MKMGLQRNRVNFPVIRGLVIQNNEFFGQFGGMSFLERIKIIFMWKCFLSGVMRQGSSK